MVPPASMATARSGMGGRFTLLIAPLSSAILPGGIHGTALFGLTSSHPGHETESTNHGSERDKSETNLG